MSNKKNMETKTKPQRKRVKKSFAREIEIRLGDRYRERLRLKDERAYQLVTRRRILRRKDSVSDTRDSKRHRMDSIVAFWENLSEEEQWIVASHDAKLNHISRLARTIGTTEVVQAHNKVKLTTAGCIRYVLQLFRGEGIPADQVQKFIDENAVAWFSLTGHPTNPTTVAYTKAQTQLARVIQNPLSRPEDLDAVLDAILDTPIVGPPKTPLEEARETLNTLEVLYDVALGHKKLFDEALFDYGYAEEGVKIRRPLIVPCAWTLGDADGNEALTASVLDEGIKLHRRAILSRYIGEIEQFAVMARTEGETSSLRALSKIEKDLQEAYQKGCAPIEEETSLSERLGHLALSCSSDFLAQKMADLSYLLQCFRFGFGMIDLRHNASDLLSALLDVVRVSGLRIFEKEGTELDALALAIGIWMDNNKEPVSEAVSIEIEYKLKKQGFVKSAELFSRFRVMAQNPDMCEKLIIAETTHPAHALAALFLLKMSGHAVCSAESRIDITILSESVHDLMGLGRMVEILLDWPCFRAHVAARHRLIVMIAKSDTTRQDGRGEAEYAQYEACVDIYRAGEKMRRKYLELEGLLVSIMNGGGHALQRGGGRVTEIPAVHGRAAADAGILDCGPSTLTIQGHQMSILFCPGKVAIGTLEAFAAQNLYSKAGVMGEMPILPFSKGLNKQIARADAWLYARTAGEAFDRLTQKNGAIDRLLIAAPWVSMKTGNVSSRPAQRGGMPMRPGITPRQAKGESPKALQGRAISGERLTAHACFPIFSVLGLLEAMQCVKSEGMASRNPEKYGDPLYHLYRTHKIHRDGARVTVNAIPMVDFDIAWRLLVGTERPDCDETERLAALFSYEETEEKWNTPEVTLAFFEQYFLELEKLTYEMISGQKAPPKFSLGDAVRNLWPNLYSEIDNRSRLAEFSRVVECHRARQFDLSPDRPIDERQYRITQCLYAAADVVDAPVGILATRTRLEPVYQLRDGVRTRFMKPESFVDNEVRKLLKIPSVLE